VTTIGQLDF
jgi:hypothetical protein